MVNYENLAQWETIGAQLTLNGRGNPLPVTLEQKIPKDRVQEFSEIVMLAVDVGLCDMYSAGTKWPYLILRKCIDILEKNEIALPTLCDHEVERTQPSLPIPIKLKANIRRQNKRKHRQQLESEYNSFWQKPYGFE